MYLDDKVASSLASEAFQPFLTAHFSTSVISQKMPSNWSCESFLFACSLSDGWLSPVERFIQLVRALSESTTSGDKLIVVS